VVLYFEPPELLLHKAKMPDLSPPSQVDPILHPADIFSFINAHRAKSKALCQGPATLLGAALMKEDSWKWVEKRQISRRTLDYGKECDPLSSLLIPSLTPVAPTRYFSGSQLR
jgi:hypothetical protein